MTTVSTAKESIEKQRAMLIGMLRIPLANLAERCQPVWDKRSALEHLLRDGLNTLPFCKFISALSSSGEQITARVGLKQLREEGLGSNRSSRPYMRNTFSTEAPFFLSDVYVSSNEKVPCITAVQLVSAPGGQGVVGYIAADFRLRDLPLTATVYEEPVHWRQLKGDPSIRGTLFLQKRTESILDRNIDICLTVINDLMSDRGVFMIKIHFSSSRASIVLTEDPYRNRILTVEELTDADILLAYPMAEYPAAAAIPAGDLGTILNRFKELRFADEIIYLRSGAINIFTGVIGVTFSCDGSHYMHYAEFLAKGMSFWLGAAGQSQAMPALAIP